jgi:hypothetical protein
MFVGYPRSGHSLIGALLDAHPSIIIAHELGVLRYVNAGFSKLQIYTLLLENSRIRARLGREGSGYSYQVPGQWQGRFEKLRVIGDKKGAGATLRLQSMPRLLHRLYRRLDTRIGFIHVMRNPYDNISTMFKRARARGQQVELEDCVNEYFNLCQAVSEIKDRIHDSDWFDLRHEKFISNPETHLQELCHFLGVDAPENYVSSCAHIVYSSPHQSRYEIRWSRELVQDVARRMDGFSLLRGYAYAN